jgi:hypothetical protein
MLRPSGGNVTGLPGVGWGIGILPIELPAECGGETVYGNAGGTIGYTGLAVGTRHRTYSVVFYFNTAGPDYYPTRSEKLLRIGRTAFCARG